MKSTLALLTRRNARSSGERATESRRVACQQRPRVLVLSSSLLTERMLLHSSFMAAARARLDLRIWSLASEWAGKNTAPSGEVVEPFPAVGHFPEFPHNYLRRLNDFTWDAKLRSPSRVSMTAHVRSKTERCSIRLLRYPATLVARFGFEDVLEDYMERLLLSYERSPEATRRLLATRPAAVLTTGPHRFEEPAVVAAAKRLGIPVMALITSWDNLSTKNRMPFRHDGYVVWSAQMRRELHDLYPSTRERPVYVVGAPQFDVFQQPDIPESRDRFCRRYGLVPDRPIILYVLGSPHFLKEHFGAEWLAAHVASGELGDVQLLVRPHPLFDNGREAAALRKYGPPVHVQRTGQESVPVAARSQTAADVIEWVNTFRHADVVVNLASTATVDAAICDRPVIGLDYDPEPGAPNAALVHDLNHRWSHFSPVAASGGIWIVKSPAELLNAVRMYIARPSLHAEGRQWIVKYVCEYSDGRCGARLANAVMEFANLERRSREQPR